MEDILRVVDNVRGARETDVWARMDNRRAKAPVFDVKVRTVSDAGDMEEGSVSRGNGGQNVGAAMGIEAD